MFMHLKMGKRKLAFDYYDYVSTVMGSVIV